MSSWLTPLWDWLFPATCVGCGQEGSFLCVSCQATIPPLLAALCLWCNGSQGVAGVCSSCRERVGVNKTVGVGSYSGSVLEKAIHQFKFQFVESLAVSLASLLVARLQQQGLTVNDTVLVPIPLHRKRFNERGFNQSMLLAREVARLMPSTTVVEALQRVKYTQQQATLTRAERLTNVTDAFQCVNVDAVKNKDVWLVDDVLTTGATLQAAVAVLKSAGAKEVNVLILGHG